MFASALLTIGLCVGLAQGVLYIDGRGPRSYDIENPVYGGEQEDIQRLYKQRQLQPPINNKNKERPLRDNDPIIAQVINKYLDSHPELIELRALRGVNDNPASWIPSYTVKVALGRCHNKPCTLDSVRSANVYEIKASYDVIFGLGIVSDRIVDDKL